MKNDSRCVNSVVYIEYDIYYNLNCHNSSVEHVKLAKIFAKFWRRAVEVVFMYVQVTMIIIVKGRVIVIQ